MRAVNLIPANRTKARSKKSGGLGRKLPIVLAVVLVVVAVGGVMYAAHSASSTVTSRQQQLSALDAQIAKLPKPAAPSSSGPGRLGIVQTVAAQRTTWDGFMNAFSRVVPEDIWLLDLTASASTPAPAGSTTTSTTPSAPTTPASAPTAFTVTGYTYSQPSVARLMRRLKLVPWLNDVSLTTSAKTLLNNHLVYQFTLGANVISFPEVGS
jgi:Tfp pilus assembly protein PilN